MRAMRSHRQTLLVLLTHAACTGLPERAPARRGADDETVAAAPPVAPAVEPTLAAPPPECRPQLGGPGGPLPAGWAFAETDEAWTRLARELAVADADAPPGLMVTPQLSWTGTVLSPDGKHAAFIDDTSLTDSDRLALVALTPSPRVLLRLDGPDHDISLARDVAVLSTPDDEQTRVAVLDLPGLGERAATVVPAFDELLVSADGRRIAIRRDSELVIHDGASLVQLRRLVIGESANLNALSDDGATLLVELPERVQLLDTASGKTVARANGEARGRLALAPDGAHFVMATDHEVIVRSRTGTLVHKLDLPDGTSGVAFAGADEVLVTLRESTLRCGLTDGKETQLPGTILRDDHVASRDDGTLVVLGDHGGVRLHAGDRVVEPLPWDYGAEGAAFDAAGRSFATTSPWGLSWYDADSGVRIARLLHDASYDIVAIAGRTLWIRSDAGVTLVELVDGRPVASFRGTSGEPLPVVVPGVPLDQTKLADCDVVVGAYGEVAAACDGALTIWRDQCSAPWPTRTPLRPGARLAAVRGQWLALRTQTADEYDGVELLSPAGAVVFTYAEKGDVGWGPLSPGGRWAVLHRLGRLADSSLLVDVKAQKTRGLPLFSTILGFLDDTRAVYRLEGDELRIVPLD
jgi:hypothetical protein